MTGLTDLSTLVRHTGSCEAALQPELKPINGGEKGQVQACRGLPSRWETSLFMCDDVRAIGRSMRVSRQPFTWSRRKVGGRSHSPSIMAALLIAAVALIGAPRASAAQEGTIKGQHGDWQIVCKPPPPGAKNEACALVQSVSAEDRNNVGLTVYFQRFSNGTRVLRVFAPLGVLLPPGLGLKIDNKDVGNAPFLRCQNLACYAQVVAEDKLVEQLKTGKTAIFIIFQTEEAGIGIPVSLAGFAQALDALK